jgi:DUF971 family protein
MMSPQNKPIPTQVEPFSPKEIRIAWSDGMECTLPYAELRFQCPCASCVDEHTGKRIIRRESINPDVRPTGVQPIGRYALQFTWSDGHGTGIYHYDRLHELCQQARQKAGPSGS